MIRLIGRVVAALAVVVFAIGIAAGAKAGETIDHLTRYIPVLSDPAQTADECIAHHENGGCLAWWTPDHGHTHKRTSQ